MSTRPRTALCMQIKQSLAGTAASGFSLADVMTNKYPYAIWNLVSESNSPPVKSLVYGQRIRGLQPSVKNATPDTLEAGGSYRLVIETATLKAEKDFQIPR